jgi:hypothetical protein
MANRLLTNAQAEEAMRDFVKRMKVPKHETIAQAVEAAQRSQNIEAVRAAERGEHSIEQPETGGPARVHAVRCPQCLAPAGQFCINAKGKRRWSSHMGRWAAYRAERDMERQQRGPMMTAQQLKDNPSACPTWSYRENELAGLLEPKKVTKVANYIVVADNSGHGVLLAGTYDKCKRYAGLMRRAGGSVTIFKATKG